MVALSLLSSADAYGTGAPATACTGLAPVHPNVSPDSGASPFSFTVDSTSMKTTDTLKGTSPHL